MPVGEWFDFRYRSANRAVCDSLGVAESDLLGRSAAETQPIFADEKLMARYARCIRDGDPVIMHDVANPQEAPEDARRYDTSATRAGVNLISITWTDVTERFQYMQRIAASERNYRLLAENVGDVVCHIRDGRFVWVSHSVEEALGAPPDHWLGRRVSEILRKEDYPALFAAWRKLSEGATMHDRVQIISMDGVTHWFHLYARALLRRRRPPRRCDRGLPSDRRRSGGAGTRLTRRADNRRKPICCTAIRWTTPPSACA